MNTRAISTAAALAAMLFAGTPAFALTLTHEWKFDETAGNAQDSVDGVTGTLSSGVSRVAGTGSPQPGNVGALQFDGESFPNSAVNFGQTIGQFGTNDFAIGFDLKSDVYQGNTELMGNRDESSGGNFVSVRIGADGRIYFETDGVPNDPDFYNGVASANSVLDGQWHDVLLVREGATNSIYIDGVLSGQNTNFPAGPADISNAKNFYFGNGVVSDPNVYGTNAFIGTLDDLRIYEVPEPTTLGLLGLAGLAALRRRRK